MGFINAVERCKIFNEFTTKQQKEYFSISVRKIIHNIDTLYYTVYFNEIDFEKQIQEVLSEIHTIKDFVSSSKEFKEFHGLEVYPFGIKMYTFRLGLEGMFDIFICKDLISSKNPRIIVQLRSIGLWLDGVENMIEKSFSKIKDIFFNIPVIKVMENRIDYAYHTNSIQDTTKYFSDSNLTKYLHTSFKIYSKIGETKGFTIDYLSLGARGSNNLFFRAYNKSREVVEQNYKGFFIDYWLKHNLISSYDAYCYEVAYKNKSYNFLHVGRLLWYLEHGTNDDLKLELSRVYDNFMIDKQNYEYIISRINGILPPVTQVTNIEFQTKRKFYDTVNFNMFDLHLLDGQYGECTRLYKILTYRKIFLDYLTSNTVSFKNADGTFCDWWMRLRRVKIDNSFSGELYRKYQSRLDIDKLHNNIVKSLASYSIYSKKENSDDITTDLVDYISCINDNDVNAMALVDSSTGEIVDVNAKFNDYDKLKEKKCKRLRGVL